MFTFVYLRVRAIAPHGMYESNLFFGAHPGFVFLFFFFNYWQAEQVQKVVKVTQFLNINHIAQNKI